MKLKRLLILMLSLVLVLAFAGTAFAQEDDTTEEEVCGDPIASLFEAYYSVDAGEGGASGFVDEITEASITVDGVTYLINEETVMEDAVEVGDVVTVEYITDESENLVATLIGPAVEEVSVCDEVTAYHEEGMGWGVLTKLYAIAAESLEACDGESDCGLSVEELVEMFNSGTGMGQLFKEYGKPAQLGVGHLRKAVNCQSEESEDSTATADNNGKGKGKNKDKSGKSNNGNGNGNGNDEDGDDSSQAQGNSSGKGNSGGKGKGKGGGSNANANANANAGGGDDTLDAADSDDDEGEPDEDEGEEAEDEGETDENEDEADTESDSSCGEEEEAGDEGDDEGEVDEEEEEDED